MQRGAEERNEGSGKSMGLVLSPVFDGSAPMPRPSWTMRLGLWLRRLMSLPTSGEMPIRMEGRLNLGPKKSLVRQAEMMQKAVSMFSNDFDKTASEDLPRVD